MIIALAIATILVVGPNDTIQTSTVFYGTSSVEACHEWKDRMTGTPTEKIDQVSGKPLVGKYYSCTLVTKNTLDGLAAESLDQILEREEPEKPY